MSSAVPRFVMGCDGFLHMFLMFLVSLASCVVDHAARLLGSLRV